MTAEWNAGARMIDNKFFINNRLRYLERAEDGTASVFFAGKPDLMSADSCYRFLSDRDFYYLTGITDPECVLILIKRDGSVKERLYVPEKSEKAYEAMDFVSKGFSKIKNLPKEEKYEKHKEKALADGLEDVAKKPRLREKRLQKEAKK